MAATSQGDLDDKLAFAFEMYDSSGDGQIDHKELSSLISAMVKLTKQNFYCLFCFHRSMILLVQLIVMASVILKDVLPVLLINLMLVVIKN